jgi:phosphoglycolate phosphatase
VNRAILFDLDGTLIDSRADLAHAVNAALVAVDLPQRSIAEITGFIGEGSRRLVEKAIAPHDELLAEAHAAWEKAYAVGLLERTHLYPGMRRLLARLGAAFPGALAVHTNKPGKYARPILEGLGVGAHFARVLGGGDGAANKPSPEGVRQLLVELGAGEATYVGDSSIDVQTAAAAGVSFIGVAWGYGGEAQLRTAGATRIARDAGELGRIIAELG